MTIRVLENPKDTAAEGIVRALEDMLAEARRSPQKSLSVIMVSRDAIVTTAVKTESRTELVGLLECQKLEVWGD